MRQVLVTLLLVLTLSACEKSTQANELAVQLIDSATVTNNDNSAIEQAYQSRLSDVQVSGSGTVIKLLDDDNKGARHQKFLVKINADQTLLFAHNIDLAPRVPLQVGDEVTFSGEYVYNPKGGIVHWTHLDPNGQHVAGWVSLNGQKYQ